jgi:hypothetical protein
MSLMAKFQVYSLYAASECAVEFSPNANGSKNGLNGPTDPGYLNA